MDEAGADEDGLRCYARQPEAGMAWFHVTDPSDWHVIPSLGVRGARGIMSKQTAEPVLLLRYCLLHHCSSRNILHGDLVRYVSDLSLAVGEGPLNRKQMLAALGNHFGDEYLDETRSDAAEALVSDPVAEAVFGDMDATEQTEFPDVCQALIQKRNRERVAEWRMLREAVVPRPKKKPKAGAKKRARAKGAAVPRPKRRCVRGAAGAQPLGDGGPDAPAADDIPPVADRSEEPEAPVVEEPEPVALEPELPAAVAPGPEVPALPPPLAAVVDIVAEDDGRPEGAAAAPRPVGLARRAHVGEYSAWETVQCAVCGAEAGQMKLIPLPGLRDGPTWHMRVKDPATLQWPTHGPRYKTRRTSVVGDSPAHGLEWCRSNRTCCGLPAAVIPAAVIPA
jgi:hypothetical protein